MAISKVIKICDTLGDILFAIGILSGMHRELSMVNFYDKILFV